MSLCNLCQCVEELKLFVLFSTLTTVNPNTDFKNSEFEMRDCRVVNFDLCEIVTYSLLY